MAEVFVSYARKDRDAAQSIEDALGQAGLQVFREDSLGLGVDLARELRHQAEAARCFVMLWSRAAAQSEWMQREISKAIQAWSDGRLLLVTLDDAKLPRGLRDLQGVRLVGSAVGFDIGDLVERAKAVVGQQTHVASLVPASSASPVDASYERAPHRSRSSWVKSLAVIFAFIAGGFVLVSTMIPAMPPKTSGPPFPSGPSSDFPSAVVALIVTVALVGIVIGAGLVWVLMRRSRQRSEGRPQAPALPLQAASSNDAPTIFVSYSRQDGRTVERLVKQIEQAGYTVWIDRESTGSQRYAAPIVRAIKTSKLVALMCSHNAFESDHVIREVYVAGDYKKPFIAFQLDPSEFPDEVLYFVSGFPRVSVETLDPQQLRSEIARLVLV